MQHKIESETFLLETNCNEDFHFVKLQNIVHHIFLYIISCINVTSSYCQYYLCFTCIITIK